MKEKYKSLISSIKRDKKEILSTLAPYMEDILVIREDSYGRGVSLREGFRSASSTGNYLYLQYLLPDYCSFYSESSLREYLESILPSEFLYLADGVTVSYSQGYDYTLIMAIPYLFKSYIGRGVYDSIESWFIENHKIGFNSRSIYNPYYGFFIDYNALDNFLKKVSRGTRIDEGLFRNIYGSNIEFDSRLAYRYEALLFNGVLPKSLEGTAYVVPTVASQVYTNNNNASSPYYKFISELLKTGYYQAFDLINIRSKEFLQVLAKTYKKYKVDLAPLTDARSSIENLKVYQEVLGKGLSLDCLFEAKEFGFSPTQLVELAKYLISGIDFRPYVYDVQYTPTALRYIRIGLEHGKDIRGYMEAIGDPYGKSKDPKITRWVSEEVSKLRRKSNDLYGVY